MAQGFVYLAAIMDWYSLKVLSWRVSNTLDTSFCVDALEEAIETYGAPEIFNTEQGSQFTSEEFTDVPSSTISALAWMARDGGSITCLWRDYGAV